MSRDAEPLETIDRAEFIRDAGSGDPAYKGGRRGLVDAL